MNEEQYLALESSLIEQVWSTITDPVVHERFPHCLRNIRPQFRHVITGRTCTLAKSKVTTKLFSMVEVVLDHTYHPDGEAIVTRLTLWLSTCGYHLSKAGLKILVEAVEGCGYSEEARALSEIPTLSRSQPNGVVG